MQISVWKFNKIASAELQSAPNQRERRSKPRNPVGPLTLCREISRVFLVPPLDRFNFRHQSRSTGVCSPIPSLASPWSTPPLSRRHPSADRSFFPHSSSYSVIWSIRNPNARFVHPGVCFVQKRGRPPLAASDVGPSKSSGSAGEKADHSPTDADQGSGDGSYDGLDDPVPKAKRKRGAAIRAAGWKEDQSLIGFTPPRVYRQAASLVGLQLVTSFINIAKILSGQRETTQRQLNAEKKKQNEGPRLESLNKRLSLTHEKITATEEMMRKIFTGSLGNWILSYPSLFLQDLYLKYLGWTLNDKEALENSRREITVAMMKSYPQLLHKYISDKAKVSPLVEIMGLLKLELYSLKRQEQVGVLAF
ncbi:hypothetical protein GW17_00003472 [Ensete ventricosum]|nr:hypothetical protein GW17_00003472 [Ensete ventricosum]